MAKVCETWKNCISELLERYGLTPRAARNKGNRLYSHTSVHEWATEGVLPVYRDDLPEFLELISSREEAVGCLRAGGYPMPYDWIPPALVGGHTMSINGFYTFLRAEEGLTEEEIAQVKQVLDKHEAEHKRGV